MPFVKGQVANPSGRPKLPEALRGVFLISRGELHALISKYIRMPFPALQEAIENQAIPALEAALAHQVLKAAGKGDSRAFEFLLNYAGLKPKETIEAAPAALAIENMSTAELLDVVRKSLPAAQDLPAGPPASTEPESK